MLPSCNMHMVAIIERRPAAAAVGRVGEVGDLKVTAWRRRRAGTAAEANFAREWPAKNHSAQAHHSSFLYRVPYNIFQYSYSRWAVVRCALWVRMFASRRCRSAIMAP